ncbi:MAG TPA: acyl-CoA dehydrogenase family protein, partial [Tianweitania sediminis]|nr:acyl-CoA dehydrogenase family protein [Tianweitania sediminis]
KQFGQTLDRFQVLQHRIVSMLLATEETAGVVEAVIDATQPRRARAIALCKTVTARSARYVAQQSVQLHGGIGVTDELKISRYFKRLMMCESLFGDEDYYTARYEALRPPA